MTDLDKLVRRLSRIASGGINRAVANGSTPAEAMRLAALAAAAVIVNAGASVFGTRGTEAAAPSATHEFRLAFFKFCRIARAKDPRDEASHPRTPIHH